MNEIFPSTLTPVVGLFIIVRKNDKKTMVKLSLLSLVLTGVTYYFTNSGGDSTPILSNQDVLTGEPGF